MESARSKLSAFPKRGKNSRISRRGRTIGWGSWAISWASWPVRVGKVRGIEVAFNVCQMSKKNLHKKNLHREMLRVFIESVLGQRSAQGCPSLSRVATSSTHEYAGEVGL